MVTKNSVPVSVIIPSFNSGTDLASCVESINRSGGPEEILIVDDGSTDESPEVAAELSRQIANVRWVRNTENQGLVAARRRGVVQATHDWIAHVDADDTLEAGAVETAYRVASQAGTDICLWGMWKTDGSTTQPHVELHASDFPMLGREAVRRSLGWWRMHGSGVAKKQLYVHAFERFRVTWNLGRYNHADEVVSRLALWGARRISLCSKRYFYHSNPNSISRVLSAGRLGIVASRVWQIRFCVEEGFADEDRLRLVQTSIGVALWALRHCQVLGRRDTLRLLGELRDAIAVATTRREVLRMGPKYLAGYAMLSAACAFRS